MHDAPTAPTWILSVGIADLTSPAIGPWSGLLTSVFQRSTQRSAAERCPLLPHPLATRVKVANAVSVARGRPRVRITVVAPGGVEPPHADSKSAALSTELRGPRPSVPRQASYPVQARGGGSSVGRAPGCGPGGRGFESPPPPLRLRNHDPHRDAADVGVAALAQAQQRAPAPVDEDRVVSRRVTLASIIRRIGPVDPKKQVKSDPVRVA
jgi:hypothetical protein